ncbi:MAG: phage holin family protein [Oscillospiraceae bacterium]|nr:phage holin family protein [Oscillospiraceae bacterium]MBR2889141.1 phage holin family protein [Oscillospiraceae bacterium]
MKNTFCTALGIIGGYIARLFGGWNAALGALIMCMAIDYATGLIVAGVFHTSPKSPGGGLESQVGWKGLARKVVTLLIVVTAHEMDVLLDIQYIRDAVVIGFCANEVISILENAGLMGLPIPGVLREAIDQLKRKE